VIVYVYTVDNVYTPLCTLVHLLVHIVYVHTCVVIVYTVCVHVLTCVHPCYCVHVYVYAYRCVDLRLFLCATV